MLKTTLSVIQQAAFGTTFSASVGGLPVVRWLPTGRDAYKNPHSSTGLTRIACRIDGRESIRFALRRCKRGETSFNYIRSGLGKFCNRRGLSLERALDAEIQLANHDHIRHGPVVGGILLGVGIAYVGKLKQDRRQLSESFSYRAFIGNVENRSGRLKPNNSGRSL
jgi:hypothetical protein